jgi:hypothetical protein
MFFGKKDPEKDNSPKCKVNKLTCYMLFGPIFQHGILTYIVILLEQNVCYHLCNELM